jgi:putative FmdB family regulatory protein
MNWVTGLTEIPFILQMPSSNFSWRISERKMPLYDYKCPVCGAVTEVRHKMDEEMEMFCKHQLSPLFSCYDSELIRMEKQVSVPSLVFKGSGFYETDYKGK